MYWIMRVDGRGCGPQVTQHMAKEEQWVGLERKRGKTWKGSIDTSSLLPSSRSPTTPMFLMDDDWTIADPRDRRWGLRHTVVHRNQATTACRSLIFQAFVGATSNSNNNSTLHTLSTLLIKERTPMILPRYIQYGFISVYHIIHTPPLFRTNTPPLCAYQLQQPLNPIPSSQPPTNMPF